MWLARQQAADAEQLDHFFFAKAPPVGRRASVAKQQIVAGVQVGKQAGFLKHHAQCALVRRGEVAVILPDLLAQADMVAWHALQAGNGAQTGGLGPSRWAKQCGDATAGQVQINLQAEGRAVQGKRRAAGSSAFSLLGFRVQRQQHGQAEGHHAAGQPVRLGVSHGFT